MSIDKETMLQIELFPCLPDRLKPVLKADLDLKLNSCPPDEKNALREFMNLLEQSGSLTPDDERLIMRSLRLHYIESRSWTSIQDYIQDHLYGLYGSLVYDLRKAGEPWLEKAKSARCKWIELETAKNGLHSSFRTEPNLENARHDSGQRIISVSEQQDRLRPVLNDAEKHAELYNRLASAIVQCYLSGESEDLKVSEREQLYLTTLRTL